MDFSQLAIWARVGRDDTIGAPNFVSRFERTDSVQ